MKLNNDYLNAAGNMLQQADDELAKGYYWEARVQVDAAIQELHRLRATINGAMSLYDRNSTANVKADARESASVASSALMDGASQTER